jgi:hypothetical protein
MIDEEQVADLEASSSSNNHSKNHVIVRRKVRANFTVLDNALILDQRLSWKALGLLTYLLSLPPNFRLRLSHLSSLRPTGRDATRAGLRELEEAGYLSIRIERHVSGRFSATTWCVSDSPATPALKPSSPRTENPYPAKPVPEKPITENPTLTSTKKKQELISKTTTQDGTPSVGLVYPQVSQEQQTQLKKLIAQIPSPIQQDVLDELEAKRQLGKLKSTIITLARYFVANPEKFLIADGLMVREQRTSASVLERLHETQKQEHLELQREADENIRKMTDEQFSIYTSKLPPVARKNVSQRRLILQKALNHQSTDASLMPAPIRHISRF